MNKNCLYLSDKLVKFYFSLKAPPPKFITIGLFLSLNFDHSLSRLANKVRLPEQEGFLSAVSGSLGYSSTHNHKLTLLRSTCHRETLRCRMHTFSRSVSSWYVAFGLVATRVFVQLPLFCGKLACRRRIFQYKLMPNGNRAFTNLFRSV